MAAIRSRSSAEAHIPGARFLDINQVADRSNPAPHMLPSAADFGQAMTELGVGRDDRIIVYDNSPLRTAARGWFMFRHFGAERVAILDGGFQKWRLEGRPIESGEAKPRKGALRCPCSARTKWSPSSRFSQGGRADPRCTGQSKIRGQRA